MGFKRIIAASAALALLLAALTAGFAYTQLQSGVRARYWVDHTHRVIEQNQAVLTYDQRLENLQRAYLITGDTEYLSTFAATEGELAKAEAQLTAMVADNADEASHVRTLCEAISRRDQVLAKSVELGKTGNFSGAQDLAFSAEGRKALPTIRRQSEAITIAERALLEDRIRRASETDQRGLLIGLAVAAVALLGLLGTVFDLARTNRRLTRALDDAALAKAERESSDALREAVFANSPDFVLVLEVQANDRFVIADINPAFERALSTSAAAVRGKEIRELTDPRTAAYLVAHCSQVRDSDKPILNRDVLEAPDGPRTWESILAPVRNAESVTDRIVGSIRDITSRVRTEERLREAQRMEAIGQLTGGVAHDFNNLLQVIQGNLELIEPLVQGSDTARRRLANAFHGAERAAQLTRQLLAFARRQPLEPQVINLSDLVGEMSELLRRTLGDAIAVETRVEPDLWNILADPAQVESAVLNLAINARDAMPDGGRLSLEASNTVLDEETVRNVDDLQAGEFVLIAIADTGEGMSAETAQKVFEPFFTTKAEGKGSGLGLSMVYGFVRQSNGYVRVETELGRGTTINIYLPRSLAEAEKPAAAPKAAVTGANQTILVVEDQADVRAAAVGTLEALGYRCLEAGDAGEALRMLESGRPVDLVFSDVVMPGAVKSREFAERVRAIIPAMPILFTSGYAQEAITHEGRVDEGVSLLSKPYAREDLAEKVARLLAKNSPRSGGP